MKHRVALPAPGTVFAAMISCAGIFADRHLRVADEAPMLHLSPHGFARARCGDCGYDDLVAVSRKGRGVCSWC